MNGFKNVNILKNGLLYSFISLSIFSALILLSPKLAFADTGNGYNSPTTVNGVTYNYKAVTYNAAYGHPYHIVVFNDTAQTCTAVNVCSTAISVTGYLGNGFSDYPDGAYIHGVSGSQGVNDALSYDCDDVDLTTCYYPSGGNSGSTAGNHAIFWYDYGGHTGYQLLQTPFPLKDWFGGNAHDSDALVPYNITRFISLIPSNGSTVSTTTSLGAIIFAALKDFNNIGLGYGRLHIKATQPSYWACQNSGAVYDAVVTCAGDNAPSAGFTYDFGTTTTTGILSGMYNYSNSYTFPAGGKWNIEYSIQQISQPWYCLTLCYSYTTILSTTTTIIIGTTSPMDNAQTEVGQRLNQIQNKIGQDYRNHIASTTSLGEVCSPVATSTNWLGISYNMDFDPITCGLEVVVPTSQNMQDRLNEFKTIPPWAYAFRFYNILNTATTSTTTLPTISYTFATSSPFGYLGPIHFDPFGTITQAAAIITEAKSDRAQPMTVWQIVDPVIDIFIYLVLLFQIIHDLTGIHDSSEKHNYQARGKIQ